MSQQTASPPDPFGSRKSLDTNSGAVSYYSLESLQTTSGADLARIPMTVKVLLENLLRTAGTEHATEDDVNTLAMWGQKPLEEREFAFSPARVIL